jgi:hypothetical protein
MDATPLVIHFPQWRRLKAISNCMDIIHEIEEAAKLDQSYNHQLNCMWGWLDWMEELHRLLYEYDKEIDDLVG